MRRLSFIRRRPLGPLLILLALGWPGPTVRADTNDLVVTGSGNDLFTDPVDVVTLDLAGKLGGSVSFAGAVTATQLWTGFNLYNLSFTGASTYVISQEVNFTNGGTLTLGDGGDVFTFTFGLSTAGHASNPSQVTLAATIRTAGSYGYGMTLGDVTLAGATTLDTTNNGGSAVGADLLVGQVAAAGNDLTLRAGSAGRITVGGIAGAHDVTAEGGSLAIGATTATGYISLTANDTLSLSGGTISSAGRQRYTGAVTLGGDTTLDTTDNGGTNNAGTISLDLVTGANHRLDLRAGGAGTLGGADGLSALTFSGPGTFTVTGAISGAGSVNQGLASGAPAGLTLLTAASTYTGGTTIRSGELFVRNTSGSATGTGAVTVSPGAAATQAVFGGVGAISGSLTVESGGTVRPDGLLAVGSTTFGAGSTLALPVFDAGAPAGTGYGLLAISGALTFAGTAEHPVTIALFSTDGTNSAAAANFDLLQSTSFTIATSTDGILGFSPTTVSLDLANFQNLYQGTWALSVQGSSLNVSYTPVPEPQTLALALGAGALGLALLRQWERRRRSVD